MKPLSDKPSKMLLQSLEDLEAIEKNPDYVIDMDDWHVPVCFGKCAVCHAGAVMANRLKVPKYYFKIPLSFDDDLECKLVAINNFRWGCLYLALDSLNIPKPESLPDRYDLPDESLESLSYSRPGTKEFEEYKMHIQCIAGILEAEGL